MGSCLRQSNIERRTTPLIVAYTVGRVKTSDLEPVFVAFRRHCAEKYNEHIVAGEFRRALQELDGAFSLV